MDLGKISNIDRMITVLSFMGNEGLMEVIHIVILVNDIADEFRDTH